MIHVRSEYDDSFGRERLTLWSGPFASQYEGSALELPRHNGYMVTLEDCPPVRVECESPRSDDNYQRTDDAIRAAIADQLAAQRRKP